MLDQHSLNLLAQLITVPIAQADWRLPVSPGWVQLADPVLESNSGLQSANQDNSIHPRGLRSAWDKLVRQNQPRGFKKELSEGLLHRVWGKGDQAIDLGAFYYHFANDFLRLGRNRFNLVADKFPLQIEMSRLEALQLWHLVSLRLGPDLLPALLAAKQPPAIRRPLVAAGLVLDKVALRPLIALLDEGEPRGTGIVDCHVHAGSALRAEFVWSQYVHSVEVEPFYQPSQDKPSNAGFLFEQRPWFLLAAIVRRILGLLVLDRWRPFWRDILACLHYIENEGFDSDSFWDTRHEVEWIERTRYFMGVYIAADIQPLDEARLLVESRVNIDRLLASNRPEALPLDGLWWLYVRIRAGFHQHFIEDPALEGLGYFTEIYQHSKSLGEFRHRVQSDARELSRHLNPFGRMRHIELRVAPDLAQLHQYFKLADAISRQVQANGGHGPSVSLIVHSVKWAPIGKDIDLDRAMLLLRDELRNLQDYLQIHRPLGLSKYLVGFDVAGFEMARPNWFYLPAFVEMRDWWRREIGLPEQASGDLGYTYHAGEDFLHLIQGLRHIGEVITFFPWEEGDRIGHGLALGLDAQEWQNRTPLLRMPLDAILFDLIWEWDLYVHQSVEVSADFRRRLEIKIIELGGRLLQRIGLSGDELSTVSEWHSFYQTLYCPDLLLRLRDYPVAWQGVDRYRIEPCRSLYGKGTVLRAVQSYLKLFERNQFAAEETYPFREDADGFVLEQERIKRIQDHLIRKMAYRHIAVEACPISNLVISGIPTLVDHPLLKLRHRLPVLVNTDNPLTFGTDLPLEFRMVYESELATHKDAEAAWRVVREMIENGNRFGFSRSDF